MKKTLILAIAAGLGLAAEAAPLWMRDARISPDGQQIAFRYRGDIYTVPTSGGQARRITATDGVMEQSPVWSPDSRMLAFASDRDGAMNIYIVPATGGRARRLTSGSVSLTPQAFTPDGSAVIFSGAIQDPASSLLFPSGRLTELYSVPVEGGRVSQVMASPVIGPVFLPDGKSFVYQDQKGMEDNLRKHHTSSVTRDIWLYDAATGRHTNITAHPGEDLSPALSPDGKTLYFLSERDGGSMNVYALRLDNPSQVRPHTSFTEHPVRFLSAADDGTLAFTFDGELYTMKEGPQPSKVQVETADFSDEEPELLRVREYDEAVPSPDGKQVAVASRGNIFITSADYATTRQVTDTPGAEAQVTWHPEGRKIAYTSDRSGRWDIYTAEIGRTDDPDFPNATIISEKPLLPADTLDRSMPAYSPDGKKLAYLLDRSRIMLLDIASGKTRQLTDGSGVTSRSGGVDIVWSPDSKWIATTIVDKAHDPYYDIAIVNTDTGELTNITGTGYFDLNPRWAMDGNAILFDSDRYGMRNHASWGSQSDVMAVFLNQEAMDRFMLDEEEFKLLKDAEKARKEKETPAESSKKGKKGKKDKKKEQETADSPKAIKVELDGIRDRLLRLTPNSSDLNSFIVTGDEGSETLYYLAAFEEGYDLWKRDLRKGDTEIVDKLDSGGADLFTDKEGKTLYILGARSLKKMDLGSERVKGIELSASQRVDATRERQAMYDYMVREEGARFYRPDMHGVDWNGLTDHYRRFLPHINNNYDFAELLSEVLGELNVSHTGGRYYPDGSDEPVATLGLLYDLSYPGPGLKVAEVVKGGPLYRATSAVRPGHIVEKINGTALSDSIGEDALLKRARGKATLISLLDPASGKRYEEVVKPVSKGAMSGLLYKRWVERNRALVDSLSGGRLGYVHLREMSDASFRTIYTDLLGRYYDREGVVVDTRWNGGGRLHEDIEVLLSGERYFDQVVRGKKTGEMPSRRWNKPSVMLICEANYSNAHGTPWVYRHKGLGKLVGAPVPGTMTSVNWVTMQDPSLIFGIPVVGMRLPDGTYLENQQLEPDILVLNDPAEIVAGRDRQIEAAVSSLLKDIDNAKSAK